MAVIEKLNESTDWVNAIACSRKRSGGLKICLEPKPLNKFIKRTYYKAPTVEEISYKLEFYKIRCKAWILGNTSGWRI